MKGAEEFRDDILWLLYDTKDENPEFSLREICDDAVINYSWVREWSLVYPEWEELFEELDKEVVVPKFDLDG